MHISMGLTQMNRFNRLLVANAQPQDAAAQRGLRVGQRQR